MKRVMMLLSTFVLGVSLSACGGDEDDTGSEEMGGAGGMEQMGGAGGEVEQADWDELDFDGRRAFMAQNIMPPMKALFTRYNPQYEDTFQCGTCHGEGLAGGTFAMPGDIAPLSAEELSTFTFEGEGRQQIAEAMAAEVLPQMAELLGQEPFNPETNTGTFSCGSCHMIQ